jgi:MshEN domain
VRRARAGEKWLELRDFAGARRDIPFDRSGAHENRDARDRSRQVQQPEATLRLGDLLMSEGLLTPAQLEEALRVQRKPDSYALLGHILIAQKIVSRDQLLSVLERHRRSSKLGNILLKSGEINPTQLENALVEQRRTGQALGDVLLRLGYTTEERLRMALCRQFHIQFFNLDAMILDPALRNLVNEKFAMKHRAVPVARVGNLLVLAMDDPTQTRTIDDLQRSTGLKIEVITSTSAHITRALERLYHVEVTPNLHSGATVDVIAQDGDQDRFLLSSTWARSATTSPLSAPRCSRASRSWRPSTSPSGAARRTAASAPRSRPTGAWCRWTSVSR